MMVASARSLGKSPNFMDEEEIEDWADKLQGISLHLLKSSSSYNVIKFFTMCLYVTNLSNPYGYPLPSVKGVITQ